ncbi:lycopene cyclase domain-containing protein [Agromyces atrinae]|uniref:Lycopene cyclase domain-containing protein n=1 Tax=Agromyces atrinae TaxID=592376 RepID=A0A852SEJ8_9MICO|nr:lycopene cyclase domain-containing protein [Agromyces atrinae]
MIGFVYLGCLLVSIASMGLIDYRYRLVFRASPARAAIVIAVGVAFFVAWDLTGIATGVFYRGETSFMTGVLVAPELPLEEIVFLTFLCYLTLILANGVRVILDRRVAKADAA